MKLVLKNRIIRAVLDAQMNLTLSLITMSVTGCTFFFRETCYNISGLVTL